MKKLLLLLLTTNFLNAQTVTNYIATGITTPSGICFDNNGDLIVGEMNTYKIFRYNSTLVKTSLTPNSLFGMPNQLAFNSLTNEIWFATENFNRISRLTPANVLNEYTASNGPYGVAIDAQGNVFYSEFLGGKIKKRQPDGTTTDFISGLQSPTSLAFDLSGNLLVVESLNNRVLKINSAGVSTVLMPDLNDVRQIAVNTNGDIYVGGGMFNKIYRLQNGQTVASVFLTNISCRGMATKNNELYISDATNNKILKVTLPALGLDNLSKEKIVAIFPNPAQNNININLKLSTSNKLEIFSVNGVLLFRKELNVNENNLDLDFLNSGIYFFRISDDETSVTKKITKM